MSHNLDRKYELSLDVILNKNMKKCTECNHDNSLDRVLCISCNNNLENSLYYRVTFICFSISLIVNYFSSNSKLMVKTGLLGLFLLSWTMLIIKFYQKFKNRERKISYELASLYSDKFDRILIISVLVWMVYLFITPSTGAPTDLEVAGNKGSSFITYSNVILSTSYLVVLFWHQGLDFFNFKESNSFTRKEMEKG